MEKHKENIMNTIEDTESNRKRLDVLEPRVTDVEKWQEGKDKTLEKIKNWIIGGVGIMTINTLGIVEFIKKLLL